MSFLQQSQASDSRMQSASQKSSSGSSSSSLTNLSTRAQRRGSRTTNACEACKKRKTKCSGPPGPCEACQKVDTFCHFNLRLDTRRKLAYKPTAVRERQQFILEGILQVLKHNDGEDVQSFIKLVRSEARPQEIATCLKSNLQSLQGRGVISSLEVDETDLVSLGLQGLFSHRAGKNGAKSLDDSPGDPVQVPFDNRESRYHWDTPLTTLYSNDSEITPHDSSSEANEDFHIFVNDATMASTFSALNTATHNFNDETTGIRRPILEDSNNRVFHDPLSAPLADDMAARPRKRRFDQGNEEVGPGRPPVFGARSDLGDWHCLGHGSVAEDSEISHSNDTATNKQLQLPIVAPRTTLDGLCLTFRDNCRKMLSSGLSFEEINNHGRVDCELLFRDRMPHDQWNIPNWACEVVRHFPSMLPETRLAAALCMTRFMPFLIDPSPQTLAMVPGVLRPTELQMRVGHDVSINFVPIPKLRNCLLYKAENWFEILGQYKYRVHWRGSWGDIGGAKLGTTGCWEYDSDTVVKEPISTGDKPKAIACDPVTNRRYITESFEKFCWTFENWSVKWGILDVWPDLSGHIMLV